MKQENIVRDKSKSFALRCIRLYKYLSEQKRKFIMSKQLLRSGTSIGANVKESLFAQSRADFAAKMMIAQKEAAETEYWLELLRDSNYITQEEAESMLNDCTELLKILQSITKSVYPKSFL